MPLRVESSPPSGALANVVMRVRIERALRLTAFAALAVALVSVSEALRGTSASANAPVVFRVDSVPSNDSPSLLGLINTSLRDRGALRAVHLAAFSVPSDTNRALLTAARSAGIPVSWTDSIKGGAVAVEVRALIDPKGGYSLRVAAPNITPVSFRDSLGLIDSVTTANGGASVVVGRVAGSVAASARSATAVATAPAPATIRRILVFAEPGWEGKFTVAALEERGWDVEVRYAIGKNVTVTQGAPVAPDTSRYSAVVALDSSVLPHIPAIRRYAQSGGGVVIAGAATTLREFGAMLPGRVGDRQPGVPGGLETDTPLVGLGWRPITPDSDAAIIARNSRVAARKSVAAVVARRFGAGRVVESAYDGVWEWRMAGPDGSVDAHRAWWSSLVSAAAYAPEQSLGADGKEVGQFSDAPGRTAPLADVMVRLGRSTPMPASTVQMHRSVNWDVSLAMLAMLCLLAEWASRRLRGAK
ncbi:MAG: hypothetical protein ABJB74_23565 [Gemmatimonas sp.]